MIGKILFDIPLSMLLLYLQEQDTERQILDCGVDLRLQFYFLYVYRRVCGSTTCGIRMFRIQVLASSANAHLLDFFVHIQSFYLITMKNQCLIMLLICNGIFFIYILAFASLQAL